MVKNHKLAQSISDAAWSVMFRQLEYKCEWYGRKLVKIDRFFPSSKRCSHCGFVIDKLPLDVRSWDCPSCKTKGIDRDINAGKNILAAGLAVIVCGSDIRPDNHSVKGASAVLGVSPMSNSRRQLSKTAHSGRKQKPKS
jgi:putative transposase